MIQDTTKKRSQAQLRVITGIGIVIGIVGTIALGNLPTAILFILIAILGGYEIGKMNFPDKKASQYLHVMISALPFFLIKFSNDIFNTKTLSIITAIFLALLILDLFRKQYLPYSKISYVLACFYWGLPFGLAAYYVLNNGNQSNWMILGIICLIWTSDTMAYFTGKRFGKNKLFPSVSPGKTWEGTIGGGVFSLLTAVALSYALNQPLSQWLFTAIIVWIFGNYGDLVESKMKRALGFKDSGNILPGHGGILDRFDSLVYALGILIAFAL